MSEKTTTAGRRKPGVLFWSALACAGALTALVLGAPGLAAEDATGWQRLVRLFAVDAAVRQSAIAAAVGLTVTAFVFFRSAGEAEGPRRRSRRPPQRVVGA